MREEMSNGEVRNVSRQDIQLVQNLIERCLQLYMNQKEVVDTLLYQAKIEPGFTELVWQKLEEENPEFFKGYHVRLLLKRQMGVFNKLLERQVKLMHEVCLPGAASAPHSNVEQTPSCYISDCSPIPSGHDNMFCKGGSSSAMMNDDCSGNQCNQLDNAILNGDSSGNQSIQLNNDASNLAGMVDVSPSFLSTQNAHMEMANVINGTMNKSEPSYSDNSDFFCADGSFLDLGLPMGVEPDASVSSSELTVQPVNESLVDIDSSSFGFLSRIPRNFSFSDLTNDFTQSADIIENYGKSPFLGAEANNFSDSSQRDFDG